MVISATEKVELLKLEYEKLTAEQRMYVEQYTPTLNVFGVTVLAGFAAALVDTKYQAVYPLLPLVLFMIAYIGIGQTHMVASLGLRIRRIEEEFRVMNGGQAIIEWEHIYAPRLVFAPVVRLSLKNQTAKKCFVNPTLMAGIYMGFAGAFLVIWCCIKAFYFINGSWGLAPAWGYIIGTVILTLGTIIQSFGFFTLGGLASRIDMTDSAEQETEGDA